MFDSQQHPSVFFSNYPAVRVKRGYMVQLGKMLQPEAYSESDVPVKYARAANVTSGTSDPADLKSMWINPTTFPHYQLAPGDLLVVEGGDIGKSMIWDRKEPAIFQNSINRVRPRRGHDTRYLAYVLDTYKRCGWLDAVCNKSTFAHLTDEKLSNLEVPLPAPSRQRAIADHLDRETARIDALIEKKTRLIELLEEKRQALITQVVTKGLDPDVPMKDSGVEWIGQVPAHWSVVKLKRIAKLRSGESIPTDEVSDDGRYPVYGSGGRRGYTSKFTNTESAVVVGRQGSCGKVTYAEGPFWASEHAVVVYPKMAAPMMWLGENLRTARLERYSNSAAQPGFGVADVVEEFFPLPTEHERWAIDQHIRERSSTITSLKNKTIQSVELLRERRSALITAAVTGQLEIGEDA